MQKPHMVNNSALAGQKVCICLESTPISAVQSFRASAAVGERMVAHVLHKWFRRQHGGLEMEKKFITLPYLHITPQRPVSEDSGETSGASSSAQIIWKGALGWTCHLQFLPKTFDPKLSRLTALFQTVCITLPLAKCNFHALSQIA